MACERLAVGEGCFGGRVDKGPGVKARRLGLSGPGFCRDFFRIFARISPILLSERTPLDIRANAAQWANCPWFATRPRSGEIFQLRPCGGPAFPLLGELHEVHPSIVVAHDAVDCR